MIVKMTVPFEASGKEAVDGKCKGGSVPLNH